MLRRSNIWRECKYYCYRIKNHQTRNTVNELKAKKGLEEIPSSQKPTFFASIWISRLKFFNGKHLTTLIARIAHIGRIAHVCLNIEGLNSELFDVLRTRPEWKKSCLNTACSLKYMNQVWWCFGCVFVCESDVERICVNIWHI